MRIVIETVDHKDQRYDTVGDWQTNQLSSELQSTVHGCDLLIRVSRMADWRSEALVAVHELVEALLCRHAGITAEQVDAWDLAFESDAYDEPGQDPRAPYHRQHTAAEVIEAALASWLKISWEDHNANIDALDAWPGERDAQGTPVYLSGNAPKPAPWPDCIFEHVDGCPDDPDYVPPAPCDGRIPSQGEFNATHCPTCGAEVPTIFEHVDGCPDEKD